MKNIKMYVSYEQPFEGKKRLYRGVDMKTYMRKKMLKGKEFIHSEGHWNDYLKYLRKEIPNA